MGYISSQALYKDILSALNVDPTGVVEVKIVLKIDHAARIDIKRLINIGNTVRTKKVLSKYLLHEIISEPRPPKS